MIATIQEPTNHRIDGVFIGDADGTLENGLITIAVNNIEKSRKSDEYADELETKFNDFIGSITEKFEDMKEEAARVIESGEQKVEKVWAEASHAK